jgi:putative ABC transport system permease protein
MVVRQGIVQAAIGLTLGLGLAFVLARLAADGIRNILFGVSGRDPITYFAVAVVVTLVSLIATFVPAQRATRVDPRIALRAE